MNQQKFTLFMGPQGSGKGTQAELLKKQLIEENGEGKVLHIETGAGFREMFRQDSYTSHRLKELINKGSLVPVFLPISFWSKAFIEKYNGHQSVVMDGFPRRVVEKQVLDTLFQMYSIARVDVFILEISDDEAVKRLQLRGRADDTPEGIRFRLKQYYENTRPVLGTFEEDPLYVVHRVNGERSIEEIHHDVRSRINL